MEKIGTIGEPGNIAGTIYKTNKGNYIDAPSNDGRKTTINEKPDGTYDVKITKDGKVQYNKTLNENELLKDFAADVKNLDITLDGTKSASQAQNKLGKSVANNLYAVA